MNNIGWALAVGILMAGWAIDTRLTRASLEVTLKAKNEALDKMTELAQNANDGWDRALKHVTEVHDFAARTVRALDLSRYAAEQMRNSHAPGVKFFWEMTEAEKTMSAEPFDHGEVCDGAVASS